jgi:3-phosphoshikimate 1-carboxyvinyltransferase
VILNVSKSVLKGQVDIPASKSHTIRAVAIASMASGKSVIHNPLISSDALSAVSCYRALGAQIDTSDDNKWVIKGVNGKVKMPGETIDVGNSGTTLRLAVGSASLFDGKGAIQFTGDDQIQNRPLGELIKALNDLGAKAVSVRGNDKAPVEITGRLKGGKTQIKCVTSQFLSSLLLACPLADVDSEIDITLLNEPDYVRITMDWLNWQGIKYEAADDLKHFKIPGRQGYKAFEKRIPADFSSATFFLCAAAMLEGSDVLVTGLDFTDSQPDKAVFDYLKRMGADIALEPDGVRVRGSKLKGAVIDMNRTPDALPAMAVVAAVAKGRTELVNVPQARVKETDRIACMAKELKKSRVKVEELEDGLIIDGLGMAGGDFEGYHDHRIVMAMAMAAMACKEKSTISTAEAMNVTFPGFVKLMKSLGADISL